MGTNKDYIVELLSYRIGGNDKKIRFKISIFHSIAHFSVIERVATLTKTAKLKLKTYFEAFQIFH